MEKVDYNRGWDWNANTPSVKCLGHLIKIFYND